MGVHYSFIIDKLNDLSRDMPRLERPVHPWQDTARDLGFLDGLDEDMVKLISLWPAEMRDAVVALVASSATNGARLRFVWKPGYDYEATITKVNGVSDAQAEYAIVLTSRYPDEIMRSSP